MPLLPMLRNSVYVIIAATVSLVGADATQAEPLKESDYSYRAIKRLDNGKVEVGGTIYNSRRDYYESDYYRHVVGGYCGARSSGQSAPRGISGDDCGANNTNLAPEYEPTNGRIGIPVVVHVIQGNGGEGNLLDDRIHAQIEILNEAFLASVGGHAENQPNAEIEFFLAQNDPAGNPTTGITRTTNNTWFRDNGAYWESLAWDTTRYMNVYTLDLDAQGLLGYVEGFPAEEPLPGQTRDRVVVTFSAFGPSGPANAPYNEGRTLIHEVGHYLGLRHVWGDDNTCTSAVEPGCYTTGDFICDTNPQLNAQFECSTSSCSSDDPNSNYMNYTFDACMFRFSPQQIQRMRCTLANYRVDLATLPLSTFELDVTPNTDVVHNGLAGGPWSNATSSWTLVKPGEGEIDYEVEVDPAGDFDLFINGGPNPINGTFNMQSNQSRLFSITLGDDVDDLDDGNYTTDIIFRNLTLGTEIRRTHRLEIGSYQADYIGLPVIIPDAPQNPQSPNPGMTTQIVIDQDAEITDLDIYLSIAHPWVGDLIIILQHLESGQTVTIIDQIPDPGGTFSCSAENLDILLDDDGMGGPIQTTCMDNLTSPPGYQPNFPLSVFNGTNIEGTWRLTVVDNEFIFNGTLFGWGLQASIQSVVADSDIDGIPDEMDNCPFAPNQNQADLNANGVGDACDAVALATCQNITVMAEDSSGATVNFNLPQAAGGTNFITVMAAPSSGSLFPVGSTPVQVTATDTAGGTATCTFDVVVMAPTDTPNINENMNDNTSGNMNDNTNGDMDMMTNMPCCASGMTEAMMMPLAIIGLSMYRRRRRASR